MQTNTEDTTTSYKQTLAPGARRVAVLTLRSASSLDYIVSRTRTKYGDRAFSVAGLTVWNSLPESVRSAETLASFKRKLKTYLFNILF